MRRPSGEGTGRIAPIAVAAMLVLGGCGDREVDVASTATADGSVPAGGEVAWDASQCALDVALVNASHVVRVDAATGAVASVDFVRDDDPRAGVFGAHPIQGGTPITLTRTDQVDGFADAGSRPLALVGLRRSDLPDEWTVFAVADDSGSSLRFTGPCAQEYDRQFASLRGAFPATSDLELLHRMVGEALLPGRGADLHNVVAEPGRSVAMVTDPIAPRWEGRVKVVWFTVSFSPQGTSGGAGLQSDVGTFGVGVGEGLSATTVDMMGVVPQEGPVRVVILGIGGGVLATPLDLADTNCRDATGMLLNVDLTSNTASCHAGISAFEQQQVDAAQAALQFDHTAAVPEFADGPPGDY